MELYKRNIGSKLLLLRSLFILLIIITVCSFKEGHENPGYFGTVVLIFTSIININGITINNDSIALQHYYFFGLIPIKWKSALTNEKVKVIREYVKEAIPESNTGLDIILIFFYIKGYYDEVIMKYKTSIGTVKTVTSRLNEQEYKLLADILQGKTNLL